MIGSEIFGSFVLFTVLVRAVIVKSAPQDAPNPKDLKFTLEYLIQLKYPVTNKRKYQHFSHIIFKLGHMNGTV